MRVLLFTGKGGVGKTTVAAATGYRAARDGGRVLICSTDPAHSLADVVGAPLGDAPAPLARYPDGGQLVAQQLDPRARLEESWAAIRDYIARLLDWAGGGAVEAEELAVVPGLDEVFALTDIKSHATSGEYDVVVVDCGPTAETVRLLSLPDVIGWYMERVFPAQRNVTRAVRPVLSRVVSMPVAGDEVFAATRRFYERLNGVRDVLTDAETTSVRLVVNPERLVVAEARRTFTYLALFGYHVDAIIANRLLPDVISDPWFASWKEGQAERLTEIYEAFAPVPVLPVALAPAEPIGPDALLEFASELYGTCDAVQRLSAPAPLRVVAGENSLMLSLPLPGVDRADVELSRRNGELFLAVGAYRRAVVLPESLRRRRVTGARLNDDRLEVEFMED
ncbi:MAG: ArsA family ATPase [Acidimicrobiia bacterium]